MKRICKHGQEINEGHSIEIMDRLHIVMVTIDEHIKEHPISCYYDSIYGLVDEAAEKLMEAYQLAGRIEFDEDANS